MKVQSLLRLKKALLGTLALTSISCAGTVTPPDSTPVYADEVAPGVEPIEVKRSSVNEPKLETVSESTTESSESTEEEGDEKVEAVVEAPATPE